MKQHRQYDGGGIEPGGVYLAGRGAAGIDAPLPGRSMPRARPRDQTKFPAPGLLRGLLIGIPISLALWATLYFAVSAVMGWA